MLSVTLAEELAICAAERTRFREVGANHPGHYLNWLMLAEFDLRRLACYPTGKTFRVRTIMTIQQLRGIKMANISELAEPLEAPPQFKDIKLTCGSCLHFAGRPLYNTGGQKWLCSSAKIGRAADAPPCKNFAPSALKMLDLPANVQKAAIAFANAITESMQFKTKQMEAAVLIATWASVFAYSAKKGIPLGSPVKVEGSDLHGKLIHMDNEISIFINDAGVRMHVETSKVRLDKEALEKKAKPKSEKKAKAKKADKKATGKKPTARKAPAKAKDDKKKPAAKKAKAKKPAKPPEKKPAKKAATKKAPALGKMVKTLAITKKAA